MTVQAHNNTEIHTVYNIYCSLGQVMCKQHGLLAYGMFTPGNSCDILIIASMTSLSPVYLLMFIGLAEQSIMACWTLGFWKAVASSGSSMIFFRTSSGLIPILSNCC
mmetsp:Transcript_11593/g.29507  ORF Transcript_11593/g.29507 Transcript_11593/m.29507 type:complete len:107 (-) Transcript_11593:438-758(-)